MSRIVTPEVVDVPTLTGTCNKCGLCCQAEQDGETYTCTNLAVSSFRTIGQEGATLCKVYDKRVDGMPITLLAPSGRTITGLCAKDSPLETMVILLRGIGRGCSLVPA